MLNVFNHFRPITVEVREYRISSSKIEEIREYLGFLLLNYKTHLRQMHVKINHVSVGRILVKGT